MPNEHTRAVIQKSQVGNVESDAVDLMGRTDLDSHANMVVVKEHAYVLGKTGKTAQVNAFSPDFVLVELELVNAVLHTTTPTIEGPTSSWS